VNACDWGVSEPPFVWRAECRSSNGADGRPCYVWTCSALDLALGTRIKIESAASIQGPLVATGLSRAHRKEQALSRRSIGTDSFLKITNGSDPFEHSTELFLLMRLDDPCSQAS